MVKKTVETFGKIDILVSNAAVSPAPVSRRFIHTPDPQLHITPPPFFDRDPSLT